MIGTTKSHYSILDELGQSGMGINGKTDDVKLDRTVAKLGAVAEEGITDRPWPDAAKSGSCRCHNMPQH